MTTKNLIKDVSLLDGTYFTEETSDPDAWTMTFEQYCSEYGLKNVELIEKRLVSFDDIQPNINGGKATGTEERDILDLIKSFEHHGLKTDQPPIILDEKLRPQNGTTRIYGLPKLGLKAYMCWIVRCDKKTDWIDLMNIVNNPPRQVFARTQKVEDIVQGVIDYADSYFDENNKEFSDLQLQEKIEQFSSNTLSKKQQKSVFDQIKSLRSKGIKLDRYQEWKKDTLLKYIRSEQCIDALFDDIEEIENYFFFQAKFNATDSLATTSPRYGAFLHQQAEAIRESCEVHVSSEGVETYILPEKPISFSTLAYTQSPKNQSDEEVLRKRKSFIRQKDQFEANVKLLNDYRNKYGFFPTSHPESRMIFAPCSGEEIETGMFIRGDNL
tara:strand:+ start:101 stop:1249 length:1149 start_codon:yes stop_codon:yes gene_type:complete